jgi:hypothetical protein
MRTWLQQILNRFKEVVSIKIQMMILQFKIEKKDL